jgi:hypothetical protein
VGCIIRIKRARAIPGKGQLSQAARIRFNGERILNNLRGAEFNCARWHIENNFNVARLSIPKIVQEFLLICPR